MSRNTILGIVIVLVILAVGWWLLQSQKGTTSPSPLPRTEGVTETPSSTPAESTGAGIEQAEKYVVNITSDGFNPKNITIKAGESVTWMNNDSAPHQVNSAPHPTHTAYPPLNTIGMLQPGQQKSLKFPDAGTYKYHDHLNPSLTASVTVQ